MFNPAELPNAPEVSESEFEKRKARAIEKIRETFPGEKDIKELHIVTPEDSPANDQILTFRRPPDYDSGRRVEELFFQVSFDKESNALKAYKLTPKKQTFDDVVKRGRKAV